MTEKHNRRRFLQTSLAAGTVLTAASVNSSQAEIRLAMPAAAADVNSEARPGRVRWHEDFAAACTAGRNSGKPVLLFHMLGRLDQKFC